MSEKMLRRQSTHRANLLSEASDAYKALEAERDRLRDAIEPLIENAQMLLHEWKWKEGTTPRMCNEVEALRNEINTAKEALAGEKNEST